MTQPEREWRSTGHQVQVPGRVDRVPEYDPKRGEHLWVVIPMYKVDPSRWDDPTHMPVLDQENLILIPPPGCYYCEQPYSRRLSFRRCPGEPRDTP